MTPMPRRDQLIRALTDAFGLDGRVCDPKWYGPIADTLLACVQSAWEEAAVKLRDDLHEAVTQARALAQIDTRRAVEVMALRADLRAVALAAMAFHATVCRSCPDALDTPLFRTEEGALANALARPGVTTLLEETR